MKSATPVISPRDLLPLSAPVRAVDLGKRTKSTNAADTKNESESITKAVLRPNAFVTTPPSAAPSASVTDHDAPERAFADTSSRGATTFGIEAVLAGSKNVEITTSAAMTT